MSGTDFDDLAAAGRELEAALPGWWWSVTHCALTRDGGCGPDARVLGVDHPYVLAFDGGFWVEHTGTLAEALREATAEALQAIAKLEGGAA